MYNPSGTAPSAGLFFMAFIFGLIGYIVGALGLYGTFKKAGQPGWAGFVPIYNFIIMLKIAGRPAAWAWFLLLAFIPVLGSIALLVIAIIVLHDISVSFGHGGGFTVGLVLLPVIFWWILWLGSSQYRGPAALAGVGGGYSGGAYGGGGYGGGYPGQGYPQQAGYSNPGYQQPGQYPQYPQQGQAPQQGQYPQYPQQGQAPQQGQYPQYPQQGQYPQQPGQQNPWPPRS